MDTISETGPFAELDGDFILRLLKGVGNKYNDAKRKEVAEIYQETQSLVQTRKRTGLAFGTIRVICKEFGIEMRKSGGVEGPRKDPSQWRRQKTSNGYINLYRPYWDEDGKRQVENIHEHRKVVQDFLGRELQPGEEVHHKNGRRDDNRLENLELRYSPHGSGATHCPHCGKALWRDG
jgi:hypothetical protein